MIEKLEEEPGPFECAEVPVPRLFEAVKDFVVLLADRDKKIRGDDHSKGYGVVLAGPVFVIDRDVYKYKDVIVFYLYAGGFFRVKRGSYEVLGGSGYPFSDQQFLCCRFYQAYPGARFNVVRIDIVEPVFKSFGYFKHWRLLPALF